MTSRFALRFAIREGRSALRRLGIYLGAVVIGVAALVALHGFRDDVGRAITEESRALLGGDLRLESARAFPDSIQSFLDSLASEGARVARSTALGSMVVAPSTGSTRLLQLRGVSGDYPLYGHTETSPAGAWEEMRSGAAVVADPAALLQLGTEVGAEVRIAGRSFRIAGVVDRIPAEPGFEAALAPRLFLEDEELDRLGLSGFGSLVRYRAFLAFDDPEEAAEVHESHRRWLRSARVNVSTAEREARRTAWFLDSVTRFLGLVGLAALLLGGVGIASAIHVYVREKHFSIAVLRCIGAKRDTVFAAYLAQAVGLGCFGAALGAVVGVTIQFLLPTVLANLLPLELTPTLHPGSIGAGFATGAGLAALFALLPLLRVRDVAPLAALRARVEPPRGSRRARAGASLLLAGGILAFAVAEAPDMESAVVFAVGVGTAVTLLGLVGGGILALVRRLRLGGLPFPERQGLSNLFRPGNQTIAVSLALGFGAFVIGTVLQTEASLLAAIDLPGAEAGAPGPNLILFDVQREQRGGARAILRRHGATDLSETPIIPARLAAVKGVEVRDLLRRPRDERPPRWVLTREYRNTSRMRPGPGEVVVAGSWWEDTYLADLDEDSDGPSLDGQAARLSLEEGIATDLGVEIGDTLVWNLSGTRIESVVSSLRSVDWARLEPNFYAVFEPGWIEDAPGSWIVQARIEEEERRGVAQREVVEALPNVSVLDLSYVLETVERILGTATAAIRGLAVFSALAGLLVLAGALAGSRAQRAREIALLRTLGARESQVRRVVFMEYAATGAVAALTGVALAIPAAAYMVTRFLGLEFVPSLTRALLVCFGAAALALLMGAFGGGPAGRRSPVEVLRSFGD